MCDHFEVRKIVDCNVVITSLQRQVTLTEIQRVYNVTRTLPLNWETSTIEREAVEISLVTKVPKTRI